VIDDDQPAVAGEDVRVSDRAVVYRLHEGSSVALDFNTSERRPARHGGTERLPDAAGDGPAEVALERRDRQGRGCRLEVRERGLEPLLRGKQFAGELGVQVAARIDVAHERGAGVDRLLRGCLRLLRGGLSRLDLQLALARRHTRRTQLREPALMVGHAQPVLLGERGHQSDGLSKLPHVAGGQEQARILSATQLVQRDDAGLQIGERGPGLLAEFCHLLVNRRQFGRRDASLGPGALEFGSAYLPLDLQPTKVAKQRPFLGRQAVRFIVQCLEPVCGAPGQRFRTLALGLLRVKGARGERKNDDADNQRTGEHPCAAEYNIAMRMLGLDVGRRRVGVAITDPSGMLARPLSTLVVSGDDAASRVAREIVRLRDEDDGLARIVVGLPRHLDGTPSDQTAAVEQFIAELRALTDIPIVTEDERLSSREAESRLALRERDWKKRKAQLDAVAAAVILQDYLDRDAQVAERRLQGDQNAD
jgi:putative holliday junction resolvase